MVANSHFQFSLQHQFFDALLDKFSELISVKSLIQLHNPNITMPNKSYSAMKACVYFGGRFYSFEGEGFKISEAMLVYQNGEIYFGPFKQIELLLQEHKISADFIELASEQTVIPSFKKRKLSLVTAALLQQWFHFGPFGFHGEWLKEMPNYNMGYIERAVLYLDKSLAPNEWLLGYGLQTLIMPTSDTTLSVSSLLSRLDICRPICILDAHTPFAYINDIAITQIFDSLESKLTKKFGNKEAFHQLIKEQGGLCNEQLLWLVDVFPNQQFQLHAFNLLNTIEKMITNSSSLGISSIELEDTHPFSLALINYYESLHKTLFQKKSTAIEFGGKYTQIKQSYPIEPLSPLREVYHLAKSYKLHNLEAVLKVCDKKSDNLHTNYILLDRDPSATPTEDILSLQIIKNFY